jgi:hypothetical protein
MAENKQVQKELVAAPEVLPRPVAKGKVPLPRETEAQSSVGAPVEESKGPLPLPSKGPVVLPGAQDLHVAEGEDEEDVGEVEGLPSSSSGSSSSSGLSFFSVC